MAPHAIGHCEQATIIAQIVDCERALAGQQHYTKLPHQPVLFQPPCQYSVRAGLHWRYNLVWGEPLKLCPSQSLRSRRAARHPRIDIFITISSWMPDLPMPQQFQESCAYYAMIEEEGDEDIFWE